MTEDDTVKSPSRNWLERLSQILLREPQDREQLINLLRDAQDRELLDSEALTMIEGVLGVSEMQVRDIMVPRSQMVTIEESDDLSSFLPTIIESHHSRFPVFNKEKEIVRGIVLAKDLLATLSADKEDSVRFDFDEIMRTAVFVPESKRLNVLLKEFRMNRNHMAIVVDEYGSVSGLVTIEDVLEQIVGEIEDEYDYDEDDAIKPMSDKLFTIKATTSLEDFNAYFETDYSDEAYDTIAGLVMQRFERLPKRNEAIRIDNFQFKVLHADNRRIRLLQLRID